MTEQVPAQLNGWKEIAAFFGKSPRTVQRWETVLALPVHRIKTPTSEIVYAIPSELLDWRQSAEGRRGEAEADTHAGSGSDGDATEAVAAVPAPPAGHRARAVAVVLALACGLAILVWVFQSRTVSRATTGPKAGSDSAAARSQSDSESGRGAWPSSAHDWRQSNQSPLTGPSTGSTASLLFSAPRLLGFLGHVPGNDDFLVVNARGEIVLGWPGEVAAVAPTGGKVWSVPLEHPFTTVGPAGFALLPASAFIGAHYTNPRAVMRTYVVSIDSAGRVVWTREQFAMTQAPTIGPDETAYQIDEVCALRAYSPAGENRWTTVLAGYAMGAVAVDSRNNLYVGTDGSTYNQVSIWSVASDGKIRWTRDLGLPFSTPVVSTDDRIFFASYDGSLLAFDPAGNLLWRRDGLTGTKSWYPLAISKDGQLYYRYSGGLVALSKDGRVRWRYDMPEGGPVFGYVVIDGRGHVYLNALDSVRSLTDEGQLRWSVPVKKPGRLVIGGPGLIYVVSEHQRIFAIREPEPRGE